MNFDGKKARNLSIEKLKFPYLEIHFMIIFNLAHTSNVPNEGNDIHEQVVTERHLHPPHVNGQLKLTLKLVKFCTTLVFHTACIILV